ncbi:hypothetical protein F4861DRAFT_547470 [Xylaria intraflava]|nr:hypothetical protein F4861DRAFT_547470 [Xylaria intraflava]
MHSDQSAPFHHCCRPVFQMAHTSFKTRSTVWSSTTSFEVVDVYTYGSNGQPFYVTEQWWAFPPTLGPDTEDATASLALTVGMTSTPSSGLPPPPTHTSGYSESVSHAPTGLRGLSNGAVAGIAIAATLVGGLLGVVIGLIRARRGQKHRPVVEYMAYSTGEKGPAISTATTDGPQLDRYLLDARPDKAIAAELHSLGRLIQKHAETHYHLQPVQLTSSQLCQPLHDLGIERGSVSAIARLVSLALEPQTRLTVIRYIILKAAFESTVIGGSTCVSLLPPMVAALSSSAPPPETHTESYEATRLAMARWRQLSAFLLHPNRSQRTPLAPTEDVSTRQAQKLTVALNRFLEPFVSRDREERYEQENHLREVIVECATFGYVLFSQPAEYRFLFDDDGGANTIVVCPGLDKIIDEEGRRYQPPVPRVVGPIVQPV